MRANLLKRIGLPVSFTIRINVLERIGFPVSTLNVTRSHVISDLTYSRSLIASRYYSRVTRYRIKIQIQRSNAIDLVHTNSEKG